MLLVLAALLGCAEDQPRDFTPMEQVTVKIPFQETFTDAEGAKRIVICEFKDKREQRTYVGEGFKPGPEPVPRKYVPSEPPTLVLPRILGGYLKQIGFNVSFADKVEDVRGNVLREILKTHDADYLIAGELQTLNCRVRQDPARSVLAVVKLRLDLYNKAGRVRMYKSARVSDADFLGDKAGDSEEIAALINRSIHELFGRVFEDTYFVKQLDMEPETVKELLKAMPVLPEPEPEEAKPEETKPAEAKPEHAPEPPVELTEEEKAAQKRRDAARELEEAVKEFTEPETPEPLEK